MTPSFATSLDALGGWRAALGERLESLARFLAEQDLAHGEAAEQIGALRERLGNEKLVVAFVAEFSRGKSELINAIFFADTGRRILPATPGRTTMCPVELGWRGDEPASLLLLPIETRLEGLSLGELRAQPRAWRRLALDIGDADQLAQSLLEVTRTEWVTEAQARALGFWDDATPDDNPPLDDEGKVEVPAWRHALINYPHPLLKQGLVVLDTPGLNAIGAEPELTLSLLPTAHATVFILGADTGVTKSDLAIWRDHLGAHAPTRFVVLNKIDTLEDPLATLEQVEAQIAQQQRETARTLGVPMQRVFPLSARQALAARVERRRRWGSTRAACRCSRRRSARSCCRSGARCSSRWCRRARSASRAQVNAPHRRLAPPARRADARAARPARQEQRQGAPDAQARRGRDGRVRAVHDAAAGDARRARAHAEGHAGRPLVRRAARRGRRDAGGDGLGVPQPRRAQGLRRACASGCARCSPPAQRRNGEIREMLRRPRSRRLNAEFGFSLALGKPLDFDALRQRAAADREQLRPVPRPRRWRCAWRSRSSWSSSGACWSPSCASSSRTRAASSSSGTRRPRRRSMRSCASAAKASSGAARRWSGSRTRPASWRSASPRSRPRTSACSSSRRALGELRRGACASTPSPRRWRPTPRSSRSTCRSSTTRLPVEAMDAAPGLSRGAARRRAVSRRPRSRADAPSPSASSPGSAQHGRHGLPWQNTRDPYRVWLSEIMLQQTQVATVLGLLRALPRALPRRARARRRAARRRARAVERPRLLPPRAQPASLRAGRRRRARRRVPAQQRARSPTLPGIGRSTAAAIAAFCFGERVAILDGNVKRVLTRVLAFDGDLAEAARRARAVGSRRPRCLPATRHRGLHAGPDGPRRDGLHRPARRAACSARRARCARRRGRHAGALSGEDAHAQARPARERLARAALARRGLAGASAPRRGVWAGCGACPSSTRPPRSSAPTAGWPGRGEALPPFKHVLTHFDWHLQPLRWTLPATASARRRRALLARLADGRWFDVDEALALGLPAPLRKRLASG